MLQLPPPNSHPILIARKLLLLGTFLQGVLPSSLQALPDLGASYRNLMARVVDTAIRFVTTNEDLIGSVEGIECIMLEAMYQNYAGELHRAWMAVRRATTVAEMMALHRGLNSPSLKILEPETQAAFNADQICFRLVEMDGYLSLMLGLPRSSLQARFATPKALEGCQPIDRMQRIHCAVSDHILQRDQNNLSDTHDIDMLLQKAAAEMPPQWWLIPNFLASNSGGTEVSHETYRVMVQSAHYHLLIRVHLPYMLRSSSDHRNDHSKITAVSASRESLARYIGFRTSNPGHFYCRGTDFLAFIATTVLCLAHIDACCRYQKPLHNTSFGAGFNYLAHSRLSDRGMMERALDIIESMSVNGDDVISSKIARILRRLLAVEADAANGTNYSSSSSEGEHDMLDCHGSSIHGGRGLHVHIPSFGTINFERCAVSNSVSSTPIVFEQSLPTTVVAGNLARNCLSDDNPEAQSGPYSQAASQLGDQNTQNVPSQLGQRALPQQHLPSSSYGTSSCNNGSVQEAQPFNFTELAGIADDWDLQGVDTALFDSLFRGMTVPNTGMEESWLQWANNG
jgi:hypothetical protein